MKFNGRTIAFLIICLFSGLVHAQVDVLTRSYNNARTGANLNETVLTVANVGEKTFGRVFSRNVIGQIYAQPLVVNGVVLPGKGAKNLVIVATSEDGLYAFDATNPSVIIPYWAVNLASPMPSTYIPNYYDMTPFVGIVGTPVIDKPNNTLYVVSKGLDGAKNPHLWLNAIDIRTGKYRPTNGLTEIKATVSGIGGGSVNGTITMQPLWQMNRPALLLLNGVIYVTLGSHGDMGPYHGWVLAYNASTFAQQAVYCNTQDGTLGGIWMSGQGPAADASGNVYLISGNGDYDVTGSGAMTGNSVVKLTLSGSQLQVTDFFTPFDSDEMNWADNDLGSSGAVILPDVNLILMGGKTDDLYLLDPNHLGGYNTLGDNGGTNNVLQEFWAKNGHLHGSPVYWNSPDAGPCVYIWSETDFGKRFQFVNTTPGGSPTWRVGPNPAAPAPIQLTPEQAPGGMPGGILTLSANGNKAGTGILWVSMPTALNANQAIVPGTLRAFDASNLNHELWNSNMAAGDYVGMFAKFTPLTVANGFVYAATFSNELCVYGLIQVKARQAPIASLSKTNAGPKIAASKR
jgi:hypothetical protein